MYLIARLNLAINEQCEKFWYGISDKASMGSGVKSILKLYLSKSIVTDGKTTRSKVESID